MKCVKTENDIVSHRLTLPTQSLTVSDSVSSANHHRENMV